MKKIDLHKVDRYDMLFVVEKFITDNFDQLPIKIITGHSKYNIDMVKGVSFNHGLSIHKERWVNGGAWIVCDKKITKGD